MLRIGVVGDYVAVNETHQFTSAALSHAAEGLGHEVEVTWLPTAGVRSAGEVADSLGGFGGLIIAPGSPYRDMQGVLAAITFASYREHHDLRRGAPSAEPAELAPIVSAVLEIPSR